MKRWSSLGCLLVAAWMLLACAPTPSSNVVAYLAARERHDLQPAPVEVPRGSVRGRVIGTGGPLAGAAVLVAERNGQPHVAYSDADGQYQIDQIPIGQYRLAAVAPTYAETILAASFALPRLVTIQADHVTVAPDLHLQPHQPPALPTPWPAALSLTLTATGVITAPFPAGSQAQRFAFAFDHAGVRVDTLRLYLPTNLANDEQVPILLMVYPTHSDLWQSVSVAYAAQGYALVAISPMSERGVDILAHAADAGVALALARAGTLHPQIDGTRIVALGGSFSSAILHRLIRNVHQTLGDDLRGWITVGGVSDAFAGSAAFYAGQIEIPPQYELLIPALGLPNLFPLDFLRYSPLYTAAELPPTLLIHTAADRVIPIEQAYALEAALRRSGVPIEVYYYEDVSHYLQIDDNITDAGREMFYHTLEFAEQRLAEP